MKNFTSNSQKIGELGENVACNFLIKNGFSVLERNYTKKWGEIDIIAQKDNKRYFIEVKSVSCKTLPDFLDDNSFVKRPEENMHISKIARLRRVVETYLISNRKGNLDWQFDLLLVYLDLKQKKARVKKMENIIL
jgi:putative endonuclease